jgi:peptide/nickel transport system substrate-binding protein
MLVSESSALLKITNYEEHIMKRLGFVLLICLLLLAVMPIMAQDEVTLVWGVSGDPTTFNTILQTVAVEDAVQDLVFPPLYTSNLETGQPEPNLATWEVSEDGLTYTFTIRDDANWSDGTPITAQDAEFTINAMTSDNVETFRAISGLSAVNVVDDKTFEVVLEQPTCGLFNELNFGILPSHKFAADYSDFSTSEFNLEPDVSGGPFVFVERSADEFLRFAANDTYFGGRPNIDQIVVQIIPDPEVRTQALQSGEIDFYLGVSADQAELLEGDANVDVVSYPINGWMMNVFNHADPDNVMPGRDEDGNLVEQAPHPILGDVRVRQALIMGWDHDDVLFLVGDAALPLVGPVTPILTDAYNSNIEPYPYDPDQAAELLDEAGWVDSDGDGVRDKDGMPLELELLYLPEQENEATLIADYLRDLGVDTSLVTGEQGALINDRLFAQTYDMFVIGIGWDQPTPDVLLNFLYNSANDIGTNSSSFTDEEFDTLLGELATGSCDPMERQPIYYRIQEIAHDQAIGDFMYTQVAHVAKSLRLTNVEFTAWGYTPTNEWALTDD